ncbi:MAG: hypothetical protein O7J95_15445, partial [Planctomycetota bacterium]|nr:hypothetical protein [Planctomycetota bacterium]
MSGFEERRKRERPEIGRPASGQSRSAAPRGGGDGGPVDAVAPSGEGGRGDDGGAAWIPYDFRAQSPSITPGDLTRLEEGHRGVAEAAGRRLSALLSHDVRLDGPRVEVATHGDFLRQLPEPTCLYLAFSKVLRTHFLVGLSPRSLLWMIQRLLGAP